ncbi:MAG: glycosyltransferase family 4 protein [Salinivirgaceae bacterium]|nr:glycosyltransferase family 4 protein [Salinivirgaceae bacterium]
MNVLYLTEDYVGSRVHHNLCRSIVEADNQIDMTVFAFNRPNYPLRDLRPTFDGRNYRLVESGFEGNLLMYRTWFPYKIRCKYQRVTQKADVEHTDLIVASTLFSDGAVAYRLWCERQIPYVVVVRGTDVNLYLRRMPHLYHIGRQIVNNAQKVIFVSPVQRRQFEKSLAFRHLISGVQPKLITITNGIDQIWIDNQYLDNDNRDPNAILYIGVFDRNKNVSTLIEACQRLRKQNPNLTLNLVGGGGLCEPQIMKQIEQNSDWIKYHGPVYDKQKLMQICRQNAVFVMISKSETFGLVYFEALTQGLPVVYSAGQGFDGVLDGYNVGLAAKSCSVSDVSEKIQLVLRDRIAMQKSIGQINFEDFSWQRKTQLWLSVLKTV